MRAKIFFTLILIVFWLPKAFANSPVSSGKFKNWEAFTLKGEKGKVCFAQTIPVKRSPASFKRDGSKTAGPPRLIILWVLIFLFILRYPIEIIS